MDQARYFFAVLVVTCLPPGILWWFVVHPFITFWRRVGAHVTLTLMSVGGVLGVVALMSVRHRIVGTDLGTHWPLVGVAGILMGIAVWIAIRRKKHLTVRIMAGVPELQRDGHGGTLLNDGIYGVIRHPRYVEVALGTLAYAVFSNYLGAYVVAAAAIPLLHLIVVIEEKELLQRFGEEYAEYSTRVPRYLPGKRAQT